MVKTIDYYMDEKFVKKDYLIIKNSLDSRRLCKVVAKISSLASK